MKLHAMIVSLVFGVVIITGFINLFALTSTLYPSTATNYNSSEVDEITASMDDITNISIRTKERIENVRANPLIPDTLGSLLVGGIGGILIALESTDVFIDLSFNVVELLPIGTLQTVLLSAFFASIIVVAFIAILAHYIKPSDRL